VFKEALADSRNVAIGRQISYTFQPVDNLLGVIAGGLGGRREQEVALDVLAVVFELVSLVVIAARAVAARHCLGAAEPGGRGR
jgi:hypothetical protein